MGLRVSDFDLRKKLIRQILEADEQEVALIAENLLGVKATFDATEYCNWDLEITDNYCGAFEIEGLQSKSANP